jgi:uncharacterized membrane-anchored protein
MMLATPDILTHAVAPWVRFYSHSKAAATVVTFLHIAPIVVGGGLGISLDRSTLRVASHDRDARRRHLVELAAVHRWVIGALALSFLSGIALLASDLDTFLFSWVFWVKIGLIVLLLANGALMTLTERSLRTAESGGSDAWRRLRLVAVASLTLWLAITFAGVVLTNVA